jgi:hypothetical protein
MVWQTEAFLVNLWFESPAEWRGSVEHLKTRQRRYFSEIVDLVAFLTAYAKKSEHKDGGKT